MAEHEDTSSPHDNTTSPQDPSREKSATGWGFFWILGEIVLLLLAVFIAVRFFVDGRPDLVSWILVVLAVALAVDIIRRIIRAREINRRAAKDAELYERTQDPSGGEATGR
jgi:membrane protein YdbS with pleckstrin-like domain